MPLSPGVSPSPRALRGGGCPKSCLQGEDGGRVLGWIVRSSWGVLATLGGNFGVKPIPASFDFGRGRAGRKEAGQGNQLSSD